jgi:hypothetical protein
MECVRCHEATATQELGYCASCAVQTHVEFTVGFRQLTEYLGLWAALDEWYERGSRG